jgi:hypothetical protein
MEFVSSITSTRYIFKRNVLQIFTLNLLIYKSILHSRARIGFDERNLEWLEKIFKQTVGNEKEIRREEFKKIVTSKNVNILYF